MRHTTSAFLRAIAGLLAVAALLLAPAAQAQTQLPLNTFLVPFSYYATAATGEPVLFSGQATIETRRVPDAVAGDVLLINVLWDGVVGTAQPSQTKYVLSGREAVMLPHAAFQTMEITFPMVPNAGSPVTTTRTGVAVFGFYVNTTTGAVLSIASGSINIK